jgi:hypothetical protein
MYDAVAALLNQQSRGNAFSAKMPSQVFVTQFARFDDPRTFDLRLKMPTPRRISQWQH